MKHVAHVLKGTACNIFIFLVLFALQACMFIVQVGPLTIPDPDMHPLSTYALATGQSLNPVAKGRMRTVTPSSNSPLRVMRVC